MYGKSSNVIDERCEDLQLFCGKYLIIILFLIKLSLYACYDVSIVV